MRLKASTIQRLEADLPSSFVCPKFVYVMTYMVQYGGEMNSHVALLLVVTRSVERANLCLSLIHI